MLRQLIDFMSLGQDESSSHGFSNKNNKDLNKPTSSFMHHKRKSMICHARPGLITLLDVALYRTNEGQLTRTVMAANATLHAFIQLKRESSALLQECLETNARDFASLCTRENCISPGKHGPKRGSNSNSNVANQNMHHQDSTIISAAAEQLIWLENFAKHVIGCANDAIFRLSTDKTSIYSNIKANSHDIAIGGIKGDLNGVTKFTDVNESPSALSNDSDMQVNNIRDTFIGRDSTSIYPSSWWDEIGSRIPLEQQEYLRRKDCWESPLLFCPDYNWADEVHVLCQRLVRSCIKHDFISNVIEGRGTSKKNMEGTSHYDFLFLGKSSSRSLQIVGNILSLLRHDLNVKLKSFRYAIEADSAVSKRLYLIKNEYRAPFRAYLESFVKVQQAPNLNVVDDYLQLHQDENKANIKNRKIYAERKMQDCLSDIRLKDTLVLERRCEQLELEMAKQLLPFCELARMLDAKGCLVIEVADVIEGEEVPMIQELLKRLAKLLCQKAVNKLSKSFGIRPLLLDLQGHRRNAHSFEVYPFGQINSDDKINECMNSFFVQLERIHELSKSKQGGFYLTQGSIPSSQYNSAVRACANFDYALFREHYIQWYTFCSRERYISMNKHNKLFDENGHQPCLKDISETMRQLEIELSVAQLSPKLLTLTRQRLEQIQKDKIRRFQVLQEMVKEVCLREMDLDLKLEPLECSSTLELPSIKTSHGIFGPALLVAGEPLPIG